jgi:hypothetical protein
VILVSREVLHVDGHRHVAVGLRNELSSFDKRSLPRLSQLLLCSECMYLLDMFIIATDCNGTGSIESHCSKCGGTGYRPERPQEDEDDGSILVDINDSDSDSDSD